MSKILVLINQPPFLTPSLPEKEKRGIGETERKKTKRFTDSVRNSGGGNYLIRVTSPL
ncbi:MAG: hypothetical protein IIA88_08005 [Bacteroidetes bacterium]|nr:hypothetical protein [Bacteroidota bacterium]